MRQKRHINRTREHLPKYRAALESGNIQLQRDELKAWLGSIKELFDEPTLREILAWTYATVYPNSEALALLKHEEIQELE